MLLALLLSGLASATSRATTYLPISDTELIRRSPVIVRGRANEAAVAASAGVLSTETRWSFRVEETIRGDVATRITVVLPGGTLPDGKGARVFGMPDFEPGAEYLLFLVRRPDGTFFLSELALGTFAILTDSELREFAVRSGSLPDDPGRAITSESTDAAVTHRDLHGFLDFIRSVAWHHPAGEDPPYRIAPIGPLGRSKSSAVRPLWRLFPQPGRWINGAAVSVTWADARPDTPGQSGVSGGGFRELATAIGIWDSNATSMIRYTYGGADSPGSFTNNVQVIFDRTSEFGGTGFCGGGVAAVAASNGNTQHTWKGDTYITHTNGVVITRLWNCSDVYRNSLFQNVLLHELGHTLGLHHPYEGPQSPHDTTPGDEATSIMNGAQLLGGAVQGRESMTSKRSAGCTDPAGPRRHPRSAQFRRASALSWEEKRS